MKAQFEELIRGLDDVEPFVRFFFSFFGKTAFPSDRRFHFVVSPLVRQR